MIISETRQKIINCGHRAMIFLLSMSGNRKIKKGKELCSPEILKLNEKVSRHITAIMKSGLT